MLLVNRLMLQDKHEKEHLQQLLQDGGPIESRNCDAAFLGLYLHEQRADEDDLPDGDCPCSNEIGGVQESSREACCKDQLLPKVKEGQRLIDPCHLLLQLLLHGPESTCLMRLCCKISHSLCIGEGIHEETCK